MFPTMKFFLIFIVHQESPKGVQDISSTPVKLDLVGLDFDDEYAED